MTDQSVISGEASSAPRWRRLPGERPLQIITAALEVFGESGLEGARLEDIAKRAGVSKGTIYLYFDNKEELFVEALVSTVAERIDRARSEVAGRTVGSATDRLTVFLKEWWAYIRSPSWQTVHRLLLAELPRFPELARVYADEVITPLRGLIAELIREGISRGEFRDTDPEIAARMATALMSTHAMWKGKHQISHSLCPWDDETVVAQIAEFLFSALAPRQQA